MTTPRFVIAIALLQSLWPCSFRECAHPGARANEWFRPLFAMVFNQFGTVSTKSGLVSTKLGMDSTISGRFAHNWAGFAQVLVVFDQTMGGIDQCCSDFNLTCPGASTKYGVLCLNAERFRGVGSTKFWATPPPLLAVLEFDRMLGPLQPKGTQVIRL